MPASTAQAAASESTIILQYPRLSIDNKATSIRPLKSFNMDSEDNVSVSDTTESLTDSTYDIISESAIVGSDDEDFPLDETESLTSFSAASPEDIARARENMLASHSSSMIDVGPHHNQQAPANGSDDSASDFSEMELKSGRRNFIIQTPFSEINFGKQSELTERSTTNIEDQSLDSSASMIHGFEQRERSAIRDQNSIRYQVKSALAPSNIRLREPFRLAYHGDPAYKAAIVEKIAQALAVSTKPEEYEPGYNTVSRHNVVQVSSFGSKSTSPQVELIPSSGLELVVESCSLCASSHDYKQMMGTYCDIHSTEKRHRYTPHLAVYFLRDSLAPQGNPRFSKHLFSSGSTVPSSIPTLTLCSSEFLKIRTLTLPHHVLETMAFPWSREPSEAVHLTMAFAQSDNARSIYSVPIDFSRFMELEAQDLNRNIAQITGLHLHEHGAASIPYLPTWIQSFATYHQIKTALLSLVLAAFVCYTFYLPTAIFMAPMMEKNYSLSRGGILGLRWQAIPLEHTSFESTSIPTTIQSPTNTHIVRTTASPGRKELSSLPSKATMSSERFSHVKSPAGFDVQLVQANNSKSYLKLSPRMAKMRRPPVLNIEGFDNGVAVPISLKKCNMSFYSIEVVTSGLKHALDVTVWTEKTPVFRLDFQLGGQSPWLSMQGIRNSFDDYVASRPELVRLISNGMIMTRQANEAALTFSHWTRKAFVQLQNSSEGSWKIIEDNASQLTKHLKHFQQKGAKELYTNYRVKLLNLEQRRAFSVAKGFARAQILRNAMETQYENLLNILPAFNLRELSFRPSIPKVNLQALEKPRGRVLSLLNKLSWNQQTRKMSTKEGQSATNPGMDFLRRWTRNNQ